MSGQTLRLEGLSKRYPGAARPALAGLDLVVPAGRILVVLGTSGAGKTTLLRVIAGLERPDAGRVLLVGGDGAERVLSGPGVHVPPERRGVGLVFQHLELWPHMTVAENVAFGLPGRPRGRRALAHPTVVRLAAEVGVSPLLGRRPATLSGGERQRVAIARTLAPDPAVLLYDEPLANLDPGRRAVLRALLRRLCRERASTLVHVTHDAEEALEMGDEIAVLEAGRVVEQAAPDVLYRRPRTLAGARALGPVNVVPGAREPEGLRTPLGRLALHGDAPAGADRVLLRPEDVSARPGSLAEVLEVHPRGPDWAFRAQVAGLRLEGRSREALVVGERVDLVVRGPVVAVAEEASA